MVGDGTRVQVNIKPIGIMDLKGRLLEMGQRMVTAMSLSPKVTKEKTANLK